MPAGFLLIPCGLSPWIIKDSVLEEILVLLVFKFCSQVGFSKPSLMSNRIWLQAQKERLSLFQTWEGRGLETPEEQTKEFRTLFLWLGEGKGGLNIGFPFSVVNRLKAICQQLVVIHFTTPTPVNINRHPKNGEENSGQANAEGWLYLGSEFETWSLSYYTGLALGGKFLSKLWVIWVGTSNPNMCAVIAHCGFYLYIPDG